MSTTPGFRPPQWSGSGTVPLYLLVPTVGTDSSGNSTTTTTMYVFDAVIRQEHRQRVTITRNPVQTGASLTDHAYTEPAEVTAEIVMSDAMQSYIAGQYSGTESRSVSAYQALLQIQGSLVPIQVSTRLNQYSNMLITNLGPDDTDETAFGLKATVTFTQIITANVQVNQTGASARNDASGNSPSGQGQTTPPSTTIIQQHAVSQLTTPIGSTIFPGSNVPGAGGWSSTNIAALPAQ